LLQFNNKLEIKRPISEIFHFLSNFENMPKWNYFVVNVKKILLPLDSNEYSSKPKRAR
jgi:uncharacterized membrane protein